MSGKYSLDANNSLYILLQYICLLISSQHKTLQHHVNTEIRCYSTSTIEPIY